MLILVTLSHVLRLLGAFAAAFGILLLVVWVIDSGSLAASASALLSSAAALALAAACVLCERRLPRAVPDDKLVVPPNHRQ